MSDLPCADCINRGLVLKICRLYEDHLLTFVPIPVTLSLTSLIEGAFPEGQA
jgi:hypothetical protein